MSMPEIHVMSPELVDGQRTMRYTCAQCHRCIEDGPQGLRLLEAGDARARHVGGSLKMAAIDVEPSPPQPPPSLH